MTPTRRRGGSSGRKSSPQGGTEPLYGVHPVMEALESGRRTIDRILVARERRGPRFGRLLREARRAGIPVSHLPREVLARKAGDRASHQGIVALVSAVPYAEADLLLSEARAVPDALLLALDRLQDPGNLGAAIRTAAAAGARGVVLGSDATVGLTATVAKASAGAVERIDVARVPRLSTYLRRLGDEGFRIVALDPRATTRWDAVDLTGRIVIVAGGEAKGPRRGVLESCHERVSVPLRAGVESLNVAVAAGVVLFEAVRQRLEEAGGGPDDRGPGGP